MVGPFSGETRRPYSGGGGCVGCTVPFDSIMYLNWALCRLHLHQGNSLAKEAFECRQYRELAAGIDEYEQGLHPLQLSSEDIQSYNLEQKIKAWDEDFRSVSKPINPNLSLLSA